jgi:hypothetical protein
MFKNASLREPETSPGFEHHLNLEFKGFHE